MIGCFLFSVPTIQFERVEFVVEEPAGRVELPIIRTGNVDVESTVRCFTMSRSAQPGSDYIDRPNTDQSVVVFHRGERVKTQWPYFGFSASAMVKISFLILKKRFFNGFLVVFVLQRKSCIVTIIDDSVSEADEQFYVLLGSTQSSKLGSQGKATVTITNREDSGLLIEFHVACYFFLVSSPLLAVVKFCLFCLEI